MLARRLRQNHKPAAIRAATAAMGMMTAMAVFPPVETPLLVVELSPTEVDPARPALRVELVLALGAASVCSDVTVTTIVVAGCPSLDATVDTEVCTTRDADADAVVDLAVDVWLADEDVAMDETAVDVGPLPAAVEVGVVCTEVLWGMEEEVVTTMEVVGMADEVGVSVEAEVEGLELAMDSCEEEAEADALVNVGADAVEELVTAADVEAIIDDDVGVVVGVCWAAPALVLVLFMMER